MKNDGAMIIVGMQEIIGEEAIKYLKGATCRAQKLIQRRRRLIHTVQANLERISRYFPILLNTICFRNKNKVQRDLVVARQSDLSAFNRHSIFAKRTIE
jgi:hypothetical protein